MTFYLYIIIGVLLLALANYFLYTAYALSQKSQTELDEWYAHHSESASASKSAPLNVCFISNDLSLLAYRILLGCATVVGISFYVNYSDECTTNQMVMGLTVLVLCFFLTLSWNIFLAAKQTKDTHLGNRSVRFLLQGLFTLTRSAIPEKIKFFRINSHAAAGTPEAMRSDRKQTMLKGILQFGKETVKDIMTSRLDVVDLDIKTPFSKVIQLISENSYSRVPVYSGTKDNIVGILYIKDLLPFLNKSDKFRWSSLIRPQLSVPETKKIDNLLREFQSRKIHIAVVIDEYGGVSGVVTMEDIIEEIVGEIHDEYDEERLPYILIDKDTYIFDAKTSLQDFSKVFNLDSGFFDDSESNSDTIAGLLLDLIGDLPKKHQVVLFKQFRFEILVVDERHISKVKLTIENTED